MLNKNQWIRYNRSILSSGNGVVFTYHQIKALVHFLNDINNFIIIMDEDSPKTFDDPEVFWGAFRELVNTCDHLNNKFTFRLQRYLSKHEQD